MRFELRRAGAEAIIRVTDTGRGIDADVLPRIFDLFVQGHRTIDRSDGGLGIGLTLLRSLVELHDGRVEADSDGPGRGSDVHGVAAARNRARPVAAAAGVAAGRAPSSSSRISPTRGG